MQNYGLVFNRSRVRKYILLLIRHRFPVGAQERRSIGRPAYINVSAWNFTKSFDDNQSYIIVVVVVDASSPLLILLPLIVVVCFIFNIVQLLKYPVSRRRRWPIWYQLIMKSNYHRVNAHFRTEQVMSCCYYTFITHPWARELNYWKPIHSCFRTMSASRLVRNRRGGGNDGREEMTEERRWRKRGNSFSALRDVKIVKITFIQVIILRNCIQL